MCNALEKVTDEQLEIELKKRRDQKDEHARLRREAMCASVLQIRDVLLPFVPHTRGSCNPDKAGGGAICNDKYHHQHGTAECDRCCLEHLYQRDDVEITFILTMAGVSL